MFLMRFTKKISKKFAFFHRKNSPKFEHFSKIEKSGNFRKIENRLYKHFNWKFSKIENFHPKISKFSKILKNFLKKSKIFQTLEIFFDQKFCEFFDELFFKPHQKDLISPNCWTVFHHSAMRFPEVTQSEATFSLFLTPDHQKRTFLITLCTLDLDPRLQPQNPTHYTFP